MYRVTSIDIVGFRGASHELKMSMDGDVNFFIGRNGTGKTRLMNLLNHALTGDVQNLLRTEFKTLQFRFKRRGDRARPYIKITRSHDPEDGDTISYEIAQTARGDRQEIKFSASDIRAQWSRRSVRIAWDYRPAYLDEAPEVTRRIRTAIGSIIQLSWISVHRAAMDVSREDERQFESPLDRKLHQVARDFGAYFSTLDKQAAEETDKFQQIYLLSLIAPSGFDALKGLGSVNADDEKEAIRGMFSEFKIRSSAYNAKLENFTKRMAKALANYKPDHSINADDFLVLTDTLRIHDAAKEWHKLLEKRAQIYEPKSDFVSIVNNMYYKKTLAINAGNQPVFTNVDGEEIQNDSLSSGEKQLFILLGETLLQRRQECIFMADEPEISLHIDWQERLVPSLRRINPNAQIIFATHSPDVVGAYGKNTIDLEKIL